MKKFSFVMMFSLAIAGGMFMTSCKKKEGCTDPASLNYDPEAEVDDGSCQYDEGNPTEYIDNGDGTITVIDHGEGTGTYTFTSDKTWILDGFVFVNDGQTLTVQAGTVIKGRSGTGSNASALIVARGARIMAEGTSTSPIIMTAANDNVTVQNDIPLGTRGLWGGLIVLGKAGLNSTPGETAVEGIPTTETRAIYGGTVNDDNSGVLKYISVRYGGTDIGSGNEINGVTFAGVGSGTVVENIEVFYNADDGFEFFGGTVNTKWLAAIGCADDAFDYDEGFRGKGQFWFALQTDDGDRGGEHDGGTTPEDGTPYATPTLYNATFIGRGAAAGKGCIIFRDNAGGSYMNSVFVDYAKGIDIQIEGSGADSYDRFAAGELKLENNVFFSVEGDDVNKIFSISMGSGVSSADSTTASNAVIAAFASGNNSVTDPGYVITRTTDGTLNVLPTAPAVTSGATPASDSWYSSVTYKGAFGLSNWLAGWTATDATGFF